MLVLGRKRRERVTVEIPPSDKWRTVEVVVARLEYDEVRLGFVAPPDVDIVRNEIREGGRR